MWTVVKVCWPWTLTYYFTYIFILFKVVTMQTYQTRYSQGHSDNGKKETFTQKCLDQVNKVLCENECHKNTNDYTVFIFTTLVLLPWRMVFDAGRVETLKAVVEFSCFNRTWSEGRAEISVSCYVTNTVLCLNVSICIIWHRLSLGIKNVSKRGKHSKIHLSQLFIICHNYSPLLSFRNVMVNFAEEILKAVAIPAYTFLCSFFGFLSWHSLKFSHFYLTRWHSLPLCGRGICCWMDQWNMDGGIRTRIYTFYPWFRSSRHCILDTGLCNIVLYHPSVRKSTYNGITDFCFRVIVR